MNDWLNVQDFGAVGDGIHDDTKSITEAIAAANQAMDTSVRHKVIYFPPGTYCVSQSITVTDGAFYGCRLEGANAESVKITPLPTMTGDSKIFVFKGGSGKFTNVGIKNMTIGYDSDEYVANTQCVGVYIDGQNFGIFENIRLKGLQYGVWLHNHSPGAFSEINQFHQLELSYCHNGIRIEQGQGKESFHGNDFNNCHFKIGAHQIGFNHQSGYLYNARFRLLMWAVNESAVYVNADGNATDNIGDITYESFERGKITGRGRFWFNGFLRGIPPDGFVDETVSVNDWVKVFACNNYWKPEPYPMAGMAGPMNAPNTSYNGQTGFFQSIKKEHVESVVLNTYNGSEDNGLYLGRSGFQQKLSEAQLGFFLSGSGRTIRSYSQNPLSIIAPGGVTIGPHQQNSFQLLAGTVTISGGDNHYRWEGILSFDRYLIGRVYVVSEEMNTCTIADVCCVQSQPQATTIIEVINKGPDRLTHIVLDFNKSILKAGANQHQEIVAHWFFQGLYV